MVLEIGPQDAPAGRRHDQRIAFRFEAGPDRDALDATAHPHHTARLAGKPERNDEPASILHRESQGDNPLHADRGVGARVDQVDAGRQSKLQRPGCRRPAVPDCVDQRRRERDRVARPGGRGQVEQQPRRRPRHHVDGRRLRDQLPHSVAVAVDGDPEARLTLGVPVGQRTRRAGPVRDHDLFSCREWPAADGDREKLLIQRFGREFDARGSRLDRRVAQRLRTFRLRRAPAPERRHLEMDRSSDRYTRRPCPVDDPPASRTARDRRAPQGLDRGRAAAVSGRTLPHQVRPQFFDDIVTRRAVGPGAARLFIGPRPTRHDHQNQGSG